MRSFLTTRPGRVLAAATVFALTGSAAALAPAATAVTAPAALDSTASNSIVHLPTAQNPNNPLAGRTWGTYEGNADPAWPPYVASTGKTHQMLATIALTPKAKWFGRWLTTANIGEKVHQYIDNATANDPDALVQMTLFAMNPWEKDVRNGVPTAAQAAYYKRYVTNFANAIGDTHVAIIQQPDGPFALQAPHGSWAYSNLLNWATRKLSALPNATVYVEGGSNDWMHGNVNREVQLLLHDGVAYAHGFAFGTTHFDSTQAQIMFGTKVVHALARRGVPDTHFVIDTGDNGRPFTGLWWVRHPSGQGYNDARRCTTLTETHCVTLGIPPTTDVANPAWGLSATARADAARYVDAYLWISRPWITPVNETFKMSYALDVVKTNPYPAQ